MRKFFIALAVTLPLSALAATAPAPQAGPGGNPSNTDLAIALCNSPDATPDQTIIGCSALIKAKIMKGTDLADTYNNRASGYLGKKQWDMAIADEGKAIPLDPANANALNNRCLAYTNKKLYDKAIADCSAAIKINPGFGHYYRNRATAYLDKGKRQEALADVRIAVKYDPQDKIAMNMLMQFAAKLSEGGAHIVDDKHPAPAALTARLRNGPPGPLVEPPKPGAKPAAKPQAPK